jgi:hypothetical protein
MPAYFTFLKTVRGETETEEHWRVVWNVTLLNLGCCWRKQAAGRPTDRPLCPCYCCFQLKLNFAIGHGLALKELLSRVPETDLHTKPNRKDTSHHITAFRNTDHTRFCPAFDTTQDNQRPSGLTSSSTGLCKYDSIAANYGQTTTKIVTTELHTYLPCTTCSVHYNIRCFTVRDGAGVRRTTAHQVASFVTHSICALKAQVHLFLCSPWRRMAVEVQLHLTPTLDQGQWPVPTSTAGKETSIFISDRLG